jgi:hypothetical protein
VALAQGLGHYPPLPVSYHLVSLPVGQTMRFSVSPTHLPSFLDHLATSLHFLLKSGFDQALGEVHGVNSSTALRTAAPLWACRTEMGSQPSSGDRAVRPRISSQISVYPMKDSTLLAYTFEMFSKVTRNMAKYGGIQFLGRKDSRVETLTYKYCYCRASHPSSFFGVAIILPVSFYPTLTN